MKFRSVIDIDSLGFELIDDIFNKASNFKQSFAVGKTFSELRGIPVGLLFFENSTRTKISFDLAAQRLSAQVINFDTQKSSIMKGETIADTVETFNAMGINIIVIRCSQEGLPLQLAHSTNSIIINAGDGTNAHPSQGLLDVFTLKEKFGSVSDLKICFVGDVKHSRVANSTIELLKLNGASVSIYAPDYFLPQNTSVFDNVFTSMNEAMENSNVVIALRVQKERLVDFNINLFDFSERFGVKAEVLANYPNTWLMHPGPVNYGVEIDVNVAKSNRSLILNQVENGVFIRMALLSIFSKQLAKI